MVLTRSGSASPVKKGRKDSSKTTTNTPTSTSILKPGEPLRVIIAPRTLSAAARFISLSNPSSQEPERYLFCPEIGVHQLTRTGASKHDPHSILLTSTNTDGPACRDDEAVSNGYVNKSAEFLTATPFDLCFTILPLLTKSAKSNLFQTVDDIVENPDTETYDLPYILQKSRALVEDAILRVSDVVEAGDESLYRYSSSKTLQLLITKARKACENGLPASLEDRFVTRVLEAPMLSVKREESTISLAAPAESQEMATDPDTSLESFDSQSTTTSVAPSVVFSESSAITTTSTTTTTTETTILPPTPTNAPSAEITYLQRLLTSFKFIVHSYLPPSLASTLLTALQDSSSSGIDFTPLTTHLAHIATLRAEAAASLDLSSFSRKRGIEDDVEAEERAEKKKKLEEEEKRKKASQSRGVQQLSKVDIKGMKKMSAFFTKMPSKGKS